MAKQIKKSTKKTDESPRPLFTRGFTDVRKKIIKNPRYTRSCFNCEYFYKTMRDRDEVCQNPKVSKYDIVVGEQGIYCTWWELTHRTAETAKSLFKRGGK